MKPGVVVSGPRLPEPVEILAVTTLGGSVRLVGKGLRTGLARDVVLSAGQLSQLEVPSERQPLDGDAVKFRLGVEAFRLGLAYEYDPYFCSPSPAAIPCRIN